MAPSSRARSAAEQNVSSPTIGYEAMGACESRACEQ